METILPDVLLKNKYVSSSEDAPQVMESFCSFISTETLAILKFLKWAVALYIYFWWLDRVYSTVYTTALPN